MVVLAIGIVLTLLARVTADVSQTRLERLAAAAPSRIVGAAV